MTTRRSTGAVVEGLRDGEEPTLIALFMHKGGEWQGCAACSGCSDCPGARHEPPHAALLQLKREG